jgi:hypothetical protein
MQKPALRYSSTSDASRCDPAGKLCRVTRAMSEPSGERAMREHARLGL